MAFKFWGKEMYTIFVFAKCCWSIYSIVVRLDKQVHSNHRKTTHTNSAVSRQVYMHTLLVQHL